jgi:hypothetical protein
MIEAQPPAREGIIKVRANDAPIPGGWGTRVSGPRSIGGGAVELRTRSAIRRGVSH